METHKNNEKILNILIVIGIIAILVSIYLQYLKPLVSELLAPKKDQTRIQDLSSINSAVAKINPNLLLGEPNKVYISLPSSNANCHGLELPSLPEGWEYRCKPKTEYKKINGQGWLPVDFTKLSALPFKELPIDAINDARNLNYYAFVENEKSEWVLTAMLESKKYQKEKALTDNGTDPARFEIGSSPQLWAKPSGLAGYWNFDEGQGQIAKDLSGNGNDGTLTNGPEWIDGKLGKALSFDGNDDCVDLPNTHQLALANFTYAAWIKINENTKWKSIVSTRAATPSTGGGALLSVYENNTLVQILDYSSGTEDALRSTNILNLDEWYYLVYTYVNNTKEMKIYINGTLNSQKISNCPISYGPTLYASIGSYANAYNFFNGTIDEVRIYNRALSEKEIFSSYNPFF